MSDTELRTPPSVGDGASRAISVLTTISCVLLFSFVIWEIFSPPDGSIIVKIKEKFGIAEAHALDAQRAAQAKYDGAVKIAVGQATAYENAYTTLYGTYAQLLNSFYDMEAKMLAAQQEKISQTQFVDVLGVNVASAFCMLGMASADADLSMACHAKDMMREQMMADYPTLLTKHRSNLPEQMLARVIKPEDILNPEYQRLKAEYGGE